MLINNYITQMLLKEGRLTTAWVRSPQMDSNGVYTYFFLPCT